MERAKDPIDWLSGVTHVLVNPRLPKEENEKIVTALNSTSAPPGLLWFSTSGTTAEKGIQKWVGLSRGALLASARSVNHHLECDSDDIWLNVLPVFHVGGCSIFARAELSGSLVYELGEWSSEKFVEAILQVRATLSALVPAQVYDLIQKNLKAPQTLKAIVVGGGHLPQLMYQKARALGWPLLPSYGMTECGSQIATAPLESLLKEDLPKLDILEHIHHKVDEEGRLHIKSPSLMTACAHFSGEEVNFQLHPKDEWHITEDIVEIEGKNLTPKGRKNDFIKIGGESVYFTQLEDIWQQIASNEGLNLQEAVISPVEDDRLGYTIQLFTTMDEEKVSHALAGFNTQVLPFERIRKVNRIEAVPRSPLGKVLHKDLVPQG